ncbi:hypothetical protein MLD38_011097 [Melastoma candidum]|uniref:Uncharacterized protein n=1 Tax=Melastoma candidum TaxID=119954 RepID=A0ACB9R1G5_9MYRT|nr:hypothetical protein MLD38_011097 [Melastoma candidum]
MAVSLNWFVGLNSSPGGSPRMSRSYSRTRPLSKPGLAFSFGIRQPDLLRLSMARTEQFALNSSDKGLANSEAVVSDSSPLEGSQPDAAGVRSQLSTPDSTNGATPPSQAGPGQSPGTDSPSTPKRSPLTARERLRAARVLRRYSNAKPAKSELGSKVLDAIKQSEGGKRRSGLPEAPTNLFDDSKRGLPKEGFTFQFPGGNDLLVVGFSFVFISTVMFATTYIVWKVGAIHFNEF